LPKGTQKIDRKEFLETRFGKKGEMINQADLANRGIVNSEPVKGYCDYIERDYK
jgi:hypothetical protein